TAATAGHPGEREVRMPGAGAATILAIHKFTGSPACIRPRGDAPVAGTSPVARALAWVHDVTAAIAEPGGVLEWVPDPRLYATGAGRRVVHLHQHYRGIPVFEAMRTVIFAAEESHGGTLHEVVGDHVGLPDGLPLEPRMGAADAVLAAGRHLAGAVDSAGFQLTDHPPSILAAPGLAAAPTMLHKLPFEDPVSAYLTYFDLGTKARLAWHLTLRLPGTAGGWQLIVDAASEEVLWSRDVVSSARSGRGDVWLYDPGVPGAARRRLDFPSSLGDLPPLRPRRPLPDAFPSLWVADRGTAGDNARVRPFGGRILKGSRTGGGVTFAPAEAEGADQRTLNAFYWCNHLHDLLYLLGFDEAQGNFQGAKRGGDRLEVRIVGRLAGDAEFVPAEDGKSPRLSLGETAAGRHTALCADVVYHEVVHGLTNRLVGGHEVAHPMKQSFQSEALDEGTCDWFALTLQNHARRGEDPPRPERLVFGSWAADDDERGLRPHSYTAYPLRFGDLRAHPDLADAHAAGQVWCAALLAMNRRLGEVLGDPRHGHELGWQLVVDALRETARTPLSITYLHTRDRVYEALTALRAASPERADGTPLLPPDRGEAADAAVNAAFAAFGMGPAAVGDHPEFADAVAGPSPPPEEEP
ncbi:MAG: M36 family metallopeptidase, partial [Thermoanaerobaculia bacterium]